MKNKQTSKAQDNILAKKLRRVREHLGLSRPKFAEMVNIPVTTLKNYELSYRTAIPAALLQRMFNHQDLSRYVVYLLNDSLAVDYVKLHEDKHQ